MHLRRSPAFRSQPPSPPGFRDFEETHAMRTHRSTVSTVLLTTLVFGTLLTWGLRPTTAGGSTPRPSGPSLPGYRSVVVGATVVSLASLDLPGPTTVPTVPAGPRPGRPGDHPPAAPARAADLPPGRRVGRAPPVRVRRQLRHRHRQRVLRGLPVLGFHLARAGLQRPTQPGARRPPRTQPPSNCRPAADGASGRPAPGAWGCADRPT